MLNLQPARCTNVARLRHLALPLRSRFGVSEAETEKLLCQCENEVVMKETNKIRSKWLTIRLNENEETRLNNLYKKSTSNSLSEYARDVLQKEPINIIYRNQSADDFLTEMIQLKNELNAIGNNFNQAVHKLHTLDHFHDIKVWAILNESTKKIFMTKVDEIKEKLHQIYEQWLQK